MNPFVTPLLLLQLPHQNALSGKPGIVPSIGEQVKICVCGRRNLQKVIAAGGKKKKDTWVVLKMIGNISHCFTVQTLD